VVAWAARLDEEGVAAGVEDDEAAAELEEATEEVEVEEEEEEVEVAESVAVESVVCPVVSILISSTQCTSNEECNENDEESESHVCTVVVQSGMYSTLPEILFFFN
jgi:hypothetical protein